MIVLVLNYNDFSSTETFIRLIEKYSLVEHIVVVDNHSTDNSYLRLKALESNKVEIILSEKNLGYGGGNNLGIKYIHKKYAPKRILLCNPDVIIEESVIAKLDEFLENHKEYGIVAPFMHNKNGHKEFNTAFRVPEKWEYILSIELLISKFIKPFHYANILEEKDDYLSVGGVAGSLFMLDVKMMMDFGMYDENIFLYCEEEVLSLKMQKAKIKTALLPKESFIHNHGVSINKTYSSPIQKQKIYLNSKLYVIRNYYSANFFEYLVARILKYINLIEIVVWSLLR